MKSCCTRARRIEALLLALLWALAGSAAESPYLYGIHDHSPDPTEYLNHIKNATGAGGWITATVALGADTNNFASDNFSTLANAGHTIICRLNYGYFPDGTIPVPSKYDAFATRCKNYVANSAGCNIWLIGNELNLNAEWPFDGARFTYVSPQDYANCFRKAYNAIKSVRPNDKVIPQASAPWGGPYGAGTQNVGGMNYPSDGQPLSWVQYENQVLSAITNSGPLDGIALHIGSRGYHYADIHSTNKISAGGQNLYFSFYVYKDWVTYGIPPALYALPLYVTECNGLYYWKGGGPPGEDPSQHYEAGWMQEVYAEINRYNQAAATNGQPVFRCFNMYRWCAFCDGWNIDGSSDTNKALILSDLDSAAAQRYAWATRTNYAINSGGSAAGAFAADNYWSGSTNTYSVTNAIVTGPVTNPAPQAVYQTERWGTSTYTFSHLIPATNYTIRLHFAEISPSVTTNGNRLFNVLLNGTQVLTNFDIFAAAGGKFRAHIRQFVAYPDSSGQIVLQFTKGPSNEAKIGGLEIFATPALAPPRLTATTSGGATLLTWPAYPGKTYRVQYKNNLSDASWTDLPPDVPATDYTASKSDSSPARQRFYRLLVVN
jgi:hypothetical protein